MWQYNYTDDCLCHYGIKGMQWGVRRYQYADGTLTAKGRLRYYKEANKNKNKQFRKDLVKEDAYQYIEAVGGSKKEAKARVKADVATKTIKSNKKYDRKKVAALVAGGILAAGGLGFTGVSAAFAAAGYSGTALTSAIGLGTASASGLATSALLTNIELGRKSTANFIKKIGDDIIVEIDN